MSSPSPVETFDSLLKQSKFIFAVFYRGHWCPYCMGYLRAFASLTQPIVTAGGTPVIITAEEESHLAATRTATGYTGDAIVDPQNLLAAELKARDLLDVAISKKAGYPHGMAQPAVLVMRPDGSVLQQWAIVPGLVVPKTDPMLDQIWENVSRQLEGKEVMHTTYSTTGILQPLASKIGM